MHPRQFGRWRCEGSNLWDLSTLRVSPKSGAPIQYSLLHAEPVAGLAGYLRRNGAGFRVVDTSSKNNMVQVEDGTFAKNELALAV